MTRYFAPIAGLFALSALALGSADARAQEVLWQDDFNGATYNDSGAWNAYDSSRGIGRTQFGLTPEIRSEGATKFARLKLQTFNDLSPDLVRGTEIISKQAFKVGTGIEVSMRVRATDMRRGIVFAPYLYAERGRWPDGYLKEEIDFEFISNVGSNRIWTNIWDDWNARYGHDDAIHNKSSLRTVSGMDYNNWTTYSARWYPDRTEWLVDGQIIRTEVNVVPDDPMNVRFNIWAPDSGWGTAYHSSLQPTQNPAANLESSMDIDWVKVTRLPAPSQPSGGKWGNGDGLRGQYFDGIALSGAPKATRVDAEINFDWRDFSPDVNLNKDNWSARWTGEVASPVSGNVTFYARADDGVRVWLGDQLKIDKWRNQSATEYQFTIPMTAGAKVPIKIEYYEASSSAVAQLKWSASGMSKRVVAQSQLYSGDNLAPLVSIAAPANNVVASEIQAVSGVASDLALSGVAGAIERVWVRIYRANGQGFDGTTWKTGDFDLPAQGGGEWNFNLPALPDGKYKVTAVALDMAGNRGVSAPTNFTLDTTAPSVVIASPKAGEARDAGSGAASGTASDAGAGVASVTARLTRVADGQSWTGQNWGAPTELSVQGTLNWSLNLPDLTSGSYTLTATATDKLGLSRSVSTNFSVKAPETIPPNVSIDSVGEGYSYSSLSGISGRASDADSGIAGVRATMRRRLDNRYLAGGSTWSGSVVSVDLSVDADGNWTLPLSSMAHSFYELSVEATDNAGNRASASRTFWIDLRAPNVSIYWPTGGTLSNLPDTNGIATDVGPGIGSVGISVANRQTGQWWNGQSWTYSYAEVPAQLTRDGDSALWKLNLPPFAASDYQLRAAARDYLGNLRYTDWRYFTIAPSMGAALRTAPPASQSDAPSAGSS